MKSLGVIGIGQFAEFFIPHIKPYFSEIVIASKNNKSVLADKLGINFSNVKEAAQQDIVILSMPISQIENVLHDIQKNVKPGSTVMDVCSIKTYPLKLMQKILPESINIIGTHPLFGPQSGKNGIKGLDIVICPVRFLGNALDDIASIFTNLGLNVIFATPEEHDRVMASTQALTHFFAKGVLKTIKTDDLSFSTPSSKKLFSIINDIRDDSNVLFRDIETLNPFAKKIRNKLIKNLSIIDKDLN